MTLPSRTILGFAAAILLIAPVVQAERRSAENTTARCRAMLDESEYLLAYEEAENKRRTEMWRSAFPLCQQPGVPLDLRVRSSIKWSKWLEQQHRPDDERRALEDAEDMIEREAGPESALLIDVLVALAGNASEDGNSSETQKLLERALAIRRQAFGTSSVSAAEGLFMLAHAHRVAGRIAVAEKTYLETVEVARAAGCRAPECWLEAAAYGGLVEMLREIPGRAADAARYQKEEDKLYPRKQQKD